MGRVRGIAAKDTVVRPRAKSLELPNCEVGKRRGRLGLFVVFNVSRPGLPPGKMLDHLVDLWKREVSQVMDIMNPLRIK
jgi:hypothetical protein